ncbi:Eco57I restriction-modification methylase domain-containing protein [Corynebacterium sp. NPDC060344]|uniref:Eco57I restriction-modification methylase domain-containing protein n=1 Tax=Corynebacterium sp. NPDC060344 TaxID=3347101 RepID=UPI00365332DA
MNRFATKLAPTDEKLRGGYYTPSKIANFVAAWVSEAGPKLLEPSCGDGNILEHLARNSSQSVGIELFPEEAEKARARTNSTVVTEDFFTWFKPGMYGSFDGVAGNPPYIRFGNWTDDTRNDALHLMQSVGMNPNKLTNSWVPFVVASVLASRPGGRIGLVIPAELMQVGYAAELRQYLINSCSEINVVAFKQLVFPGILQEVILLLAVKGNGPARMQIIEVDDAAALDSLEVSSAHVRAHLHTKEKWTKYFLSPDQVELMRALRADPRLRPIEEFASVDVGVVTGRNSFFVMTSEEAESHGLNDLTIPMVTRSAQLNGTTYTDTDHHNAPGKTELLDARGIDLNKHARLREYVTLGEAAQVHTGYKCRIRKKWWVVPSIWEADAFMLRQIHTHPRIVANLTSATSTDTVHRMRMVNGTSARHLATAAFNSITFAMSEIIGRSYGGGVLTLEPSEAEEIPTPNPSLIPDALVEKVDGLVRAKDIEGALNIVDKMVLIDHLGFSPDEVTLARTTWKTLRDRRNSRTKKKAD